MKYIVKTALLALMLQCAGSAIAQEQVNAPAPDKKFEAGFDGMLAVSAGEKTYAVNVGGPSLKYKFTSFLKIGVGAFPSLFVRDRQAVPRLAVSPIVEYKRWMFITPYFGYDSKGKQIWTFGFGYKFI